MAWFAGFIPAKNPQYAYAAVYEGDPGESSISGGKKAAPMVREVFNRVYRLKKARGEPMSGRANSNALAKRKEGSETETEADEDKTKEEKKTRRRISKRRTTEEGETASSTNRTNRVEMNVPREPRAPSENAPQKRTGVRSFFRKIFKGNE
jgi:hypothetical protein